MAAKSRHPSRIITVRNCQINSLFTHCKSPTVAKINQNISIFLMLTWKPRLNETNKLLQRVYKLRKFCKQCTFHGSSRLLKILSPAESLLQHDWHDKIARVNVARIFLSLAWNRKFCLLQVKSTYLRLKVFLNAQKRWEKPVSAFCL